MWIPVLQKISSKPPYYFGYLDGKPYEMLSENKTDLNTGIKNWKSDLISSPLLQISNIYFNSQTLTWVHYTLKNAHKKGKIVNGALI